VRGSAGDCRKGSRDSWKAFASSYSEQSLINVSVSRSEPTASACVFITRLLQALLSCSRFQILPSETFLMNTLSVVAFARAILWPFYNTICMPTSSWSSFSPISCFSNWYAAFPVQCPEKTLRTAEFPASVRPIAVMVS
jgi:hypothetical protein